MDGVFTILLVIKVILCWAHGVRILIISLSLSKIFNPFMVQILCVLTKGFLMTMSWSYLKPEAKSVGLSGL
jgi:hypothetical protein